MPGFDNYLLFPFDSAPFVGHSSFIDGERSSPRHPEPEYLMRNDIHSPANVIPSDYAYVGSFDQWPSVGAFVSPVRADYDTVFGTVNALTWEHAEYTAGRRLIGNDGVHLHHVGDANVEPSLSGGANCDHCGARIRYVTVYRHTPTGKVVAVGNDCAGNTFDCCSRRDLDVKRLRERAATAAERNRVFGQASKFCEATCPELTEWLLSPAAKEVGGIFADLSEKLRRFGSLSEKQVEFARKLLREHFERQRNGGLTDRQVEFAKEKEAAADCPKGRVEITGTIVKTEDRYTEYGAVTKMVVKADSGFAVWLTMPSGLDAGKGDRIAVTVTVTPSDKDSKFGFGSRPSKAKRLEAVTV